MEKEDGRQVDIGIEDRQLTVERTQQDKTGGSKCVFKDAVMTVTSRADQISGIYRDDKNGHRLGHSAQDGLCDENDTKAPKIHSNPSVVEIHNFVCSLLCYFCHL